MNNISLISYEDKYINIVEEMEKGESSSNFIHQIKERLIYSKNRKFEPDTAFLVALNDEIVGYIYLSSMYNNKMYIEYLIRKKYRKKGIGYRVVDEVSEDIFTKFPNLKELRLNIYKSNLASMKLANKLGFFIDDNDYNMEKIDFIKDNPYYKRKTY